MPNLDLARLKEDAALGYPVHADDQRAFIAEIERLCGDNETTDGNDAAHPLYRRGSDATFSAMSEQLRKILDGEDDCSGACQEPWDTLRHRVLRLRSANVQLREALEALLGADLDYPLDPLDSGHGGYSNRQWQEAWNQARAAIAAAEVKS